MSRPLLSMLVFTAALHCLAEDKAPETKEDAVRQFVTAFFSEDEKALEGICAGEMTRDMRSYFWIKRTLHENAKDIDAQHNWKGKIEILKSIREEIMSMQGVISQKEEDVFIVRVDGKRFKVGVDSDKHIILFDNAPEEKQ